MGKKIVLLITVALLLVLSTVFSVFIIKTFAAKIKTHNLIIQNYRDTRASDKILKEVSAPRNEAVRNLVFVVLMDVSLAFVSSIAVYFIVRGEVASEVSGATRYNYEVYRARREARRAERQEKKRRHLQEKLERISREHE